MEASHVDPTWIEAQRKVGWPDMHPEDFCHLCGNPNPLWYVDTRAQWLEATEGWAAITGREGICCPTCFERMFNEGREKKWILRVVMEPLP